VPPNDIKKIVSQIENADIVIGSRTARGADAKISLMRRIVGASFHLFCLPLLPEIKDASCGAKLFKINSAKKIFQMQKLDRFAFDIEILWLAKKLNYKIKEVGIEWREVPDSKVKVSRDAPEMFFSVLGIYKRNFLNLK
jgi:dolichyl-phosphate beta-glucosyltransferase